MHKCGFTHASRAEIRIFTLRDIKFRTILVRKNVFLTNVNTSLAFGDTRQKTFHRTRIVMYYYPILTPKPAAFVTCWAVKKWGNARPYTKSRKKVRKGVVRKEKKMLGRILKVRKSVVRIEKNSTLRYEILYHEVWKCGFTHSEWYKKPYLGACDCLETEKPVSFSVVFGMQS